MYWNELKPDIVFLVDKETPWEQELDSDVFRLVRERYKELGQKPQVDLLVMNTKDEDQLAMDGIAYPLAVELREIPLLML